MIWRLKGSLFFAFYILRTTSHAQDKIWKRISLIAISSLILYAWHAEHAISIKQANISKDINVQVYFATFQLK